MVIEFKKNVVLLAVVICCVCNFMPKCYTKRAMYFSLERPQVSFFDKDFYSSAFFKSRLVSRVDPIHYVSLNYTSKKIMNNNITVSLYVYQLLSNVYKRSFVELHYKFCDIIEKDTIIGESMREGYYRVPEKERVMPVLKCPAIPGLYRYWNIRFNATAIIDNFPFQQGRVYINITHEGRPNANGFVDFELKPILNHKNN